MANAVRIVPASRTANIAYAVRDVVLLAQEVAATGKEMLYLNIGDPNLFDFATPPHIIDAVAEAMRANHCGYAPSSGVASARQAIRAEADRKGIKAVQDVFVTTGASEAIDLCLQLSQFVPQPIVLLLERSVLSFQDFYPALEIGRVVGWVSLVHPLQVAGCEALFHVSFLILGEVAGLGLLTTASYGSIPDRRRLRTPLAWRKG